MTPPSLSDSAYVSMTVILDPVALISDLLSVLARIFLIVKVSQTQLHLLFIVVGTFMVNRQIVPQRCFRPAHIKTLIHFDCISFGSC